VASQYLRLTCDRAAEAVLALLRNPEYAVYGAAKVRKEAGLDAGEDAFNEVSLQERGKFKKETLVNVGGRSRSKRMSRCAAEMLLAVPLLRFRRMLLCWRVAAAPALTSASYAAACIIHAQDTQRAVSRQ
jgi:hypothetical protein